MKVMSLKHESLLKITVLWTMYYIVQVIFTNTLDRKQKSVFLCVCVCVWHAANTLLFQSCAEGVLSVVVCIHIR